MEYFVLKLIRNDSVSGKSFWAQMLMIIALPSLLEKKKREMVRGSLLFKANVLNMF